MTEKQYKELELDENGDYDVGNFTDNQLSDYYWDCPESIPDKTIVINQGKEPMLQILETKNLKQSHTE